MWLLVAFIAVPLIEIGLFIQVGGAIGLWPTLLVVVITAVLGTILVRGQGLAAMAQVKHSLSSFGDPTEPLAHGMMILFSGALLLTPGFFTDGVGFALLVPGIRTWIIKKVAERIKVSTVQMGGMHQQNDPFGHASRANEAPASVIDGEYEEVDPQNRPSQGSSGWTKQ